MFWNKASSSRCRGFRLPPNHRLNQFRSPIDATFTCWSIAAKTRPPRRARASLGSLDSLSHGGQRGGVALADEGGPVERVLERAVAVRLPGQLLQGAPRPGVARGEPVDHGAAEPLRPQLAHGGVAGSPLGLAEGQV